MKLNSLQNNRTYLNTLNTKNILKDQYPKAKILIGNFGYVIVPTNRDKNILKYYISKTFFEKEFDNYKKVYQKVLVPSILRQGKCQIGEQELYVMEFENIRKYQKKYSYMQDINIKSIAEILSNIHSIDFKDGRTLLHGNLHESNFFINQKGKLGIFDLVSMFNGRIEYDFAMIYINSLYDDGLIDNLLGFYSYKSYFTYTVMYKIVLQKIIENIKLKRPVRDEGIDGLYKALVKIKSKLGYLNY